MFFGACFPSQNRARWLTNQRGLLAVIFARNDRMTYSFHEQATMKPLISCWYSKTQRVQPCYKWMRALFVATVCLSIWQRPWDEYFQTLFFIFSSIFFALWCKIIARTVTMQPPLRNESCVWEDYYAGIAQTTLNSVYCAGPTYIFSDAHDGQL